ncbi:meiotic recombination protein SPO11-1-like isoform X1 [Lycium barbarum]|uniref:meiotic recombination protein SPO11-1-like isoform X1 n=1 Tax=Lycium barbarum TaxID=112863 RepID=UPI00293F2EBD|nr:meiotic recombination protein SPO11-1-like isoform X1 [Lycium barbarum]
MEGNRSDTQPLTLIRKIKGFTRSIVEDLARGRTPLIYIDRFRNYCTDTSGNCFCSSGLSTGKEAISLKRECHARRLDVLLRVLVIVQQLLQENRHGSKRDIYYMHPTVFKEQSVVDRAINDICILLQCSRHNLNVVSVGNGCVTSIQLILPCRIVLPYTYSLSSLYAMLFFILNISYLQSFLLEHFKCFFFS